MKHSRTTNSMERLFMSADLVHKREPVNRANTDVILEMYLNCSGCSGSKLFGCICCNVGNVKVLILQYFCCPND